MTVVDIDDLMLAGGVALLCWSYLGKWEAERKFEAGCRKTALLRHKKAERRRKKAERAGLVWLQHSSPPWEPAS